MICFKGFGRGSGCFLISSLMRDSFALYLFFLVYSDCGHAHVAIKVYLTFANYFKNSI